MRNAWFPFAILVLLVLLVAGIISRPDSPPVVIAYVPTEAVATEAVVPTIVPPSALPTIAPTVATLVPPSATPLPTAAPTFTPAPTATPTPVPVTEAEVLAAYEAWIDSWTTPGGDYEALTADGTLRFILSTACREAPAASSPEVLEISTGPTPTARLSDEITYYDCTHGRGVAYLTGEFTLVQTPTGWQMTRWYMPGPTPRPVPTRDPNAPTAAPQPTAVPWDSYSFTRRVIAGINQLRAANGVGQVEYADWLQAFANDLAGRYYNTGPGPGQEQLDAWRAEVAANGAYIAVMRYNFNIQNTFGCDGIPPTGEDTATAFQGYEMILGSFHYMTAGYLGPHDGPCGPSVTLVILAVP